MTAPIIGTYNDGLIAELYERYLQDPSQVDESWRQYFRFAESLVGKASATQAPDCSTITGFKSSS